MKYVHIVKYFMHREIMLNAIANGETGRLRGTKRYYKEIGVSSSGGGGKGLENRNLI